MSDFICYKCGLYENLLNGPLTMLKAVILNEDKTKIILSRSICPSCNEKYELKYFPSTCYDCGEEMPGNYCSNCGGESRNQDRYEFVLSELN